LLEASYKLDAETVHIGAVKDLTNEVRWEVYHQDKWMQRLTPAWVVTLGDPIGCCRRATEEEESFERGRVEEVMMRWQGQREGGGRREVTHRKTIQKLRSTLHAIGRARVHRWGRVDDSKEG
jgi:hypothetical protein